jgi:hypothetical protein
MQSVNKKVNQSCGNSSFLLYKFKKRGKEAMNNVLFNTIMNNLLVSGSKHLAVIPRELLSVDPAYQRLEAGRSKKIAKLHKEFDHTLMDPLLVVPHPEEGTFSIVDGNGRCCASEGILDALECVVITTAPTDPEERRKYEASIFVRQSNCTEKVSKMQQHKAGLVLNDPVCTAIQKVIDEYNLTISNYKGNQSAGAIGSYDLAYNISRSSGYIGLEAIVGTCYRAGYTMEINGLSKYVLHALYTIYTYYGSVGLFKLVPIMRETEPSTLRAKGLAAYPERPGMSLALYMQDYLVSIGEAKMFNERGRKIS